MRIELSDRDISSAEITDELSADPVIEIRLRYTDEYIQLDKDDVIKIVEAFGLKVTE